MKLKAIAAILIMLHSTMLLWGCSSTEPAAVIDGDAESMDSADPDTDADTMDSDESMDHDKDSPSEEEATESGDEAEVDTADIPCPDIDPNTGTLCDDGNPDTIGDIWLGGTCVGYDPYSCVGKPCDSYNDCSCGSAMCMGIHPKKTCQRALVLDHRGGIDAPEARTMDSDAGVNLLAIVWGDVVRVMETDTWHEVRSFANPREGIPINDVALSPDGTMITAIDYNKTIKILSMSDMQILHEFDIDQNPFSVQFHPCRNILAIGGCVEQTVSGSCTAGQLLLYDLDNIDTPLSVDIGGNVSDIQFSKDGSVIAISYDEKDWRGSGGLWVANTDTLEPLWEETLEKRPSAMALSPDGTRFALGTSDMYPSYIRMRSLTEHREMWNYSRDGFPVRTLTFSPDGTTLTGIEDYKGKQWNAATGEIVWESPRAIGFSSAISKLIPDRSGEKLYALSTEYNYSALYLLQTSDGTELESPIPVRRYLDAVATSPAGDIHMVSGRSDMQAIDAQTGWKIQSMELDGIIRRIFFNHQGSRIVASTFYQEENRYTHKIMDNSLGEVTTLDLTNVPSLVTAVAFTADNSQVLGHKDRSLYYWSADSGILEHTAELPHTVHGFSSDGSRVITIDDSGTIRIFETATMTELFNLAAPCPYEGTASMRYSSDETRLIGYIAPYTFIYDMQRHIYIMQLEIDRRGHAISPDGRFMAIGGAPASISVMDAETLELLFSHNCDRVNGFEAPVETVRFSSDGKTLFSGYGERVFHMIDISWLYENPTPLP